MGAEFKITQYVIEKGKKAPNYLIDSDIGGKVTLEQLLDFTKRSLIAISDTVLEEELAKGFDKKAKLVVDGKEGKSKYEVNPLGKIQYIARADFKKMVLYAFDAIATRSKVVKGRYFANNAVFYNSYPIATTRTELEKWLETKNSFNDSDFLRFVNLVPYARKLEYLGISKGRRQSKTRDPSRSDKSKVGIKIKVPNGAYTLAYRAIKRKFKHNVKNLSFHFLPGSQMGLTGPGRTFKKGGKKGQKGRPYLYPSILITLSEKGLIASKSDGEGANL